MCKKYPRKIILKVIYKNRIRHKHFWSKPSKYSERGKKKDPFKFIWLTLEFACFLIEKNNCRVSLTPIYSLNCDPPSYL